MENEMFEELLASVREGGAIMRGEIEPSRIFDYKELDAKKIRKKYDLSQRQFASMLGISVRTLQNYEQGKRSPVGPARVLLAVANSHPEVLLDTVKAMQTTL
ncbi:MAG: helix-turn-helix domain-containing protein [Anaerolineaceae bacterium]|nr:helix-turn-helix domain-containing protein [Anaerolineaceae bacterium]